MEEERKSLLYKIGPLFSFLLNPRLLYLLSIGLSIYLVYTNHQKATLLREEYSAVDIQGTFLDRDIHQINFFVWSGLNQIKRKMQGLSSVEVWSVNTERRRYVINASASSTTSNYAELAGDTLLIKNPVGTIIKRLYRIQSFGCNACRSGIQPTYANFAANFRLVRLVQQERDQFVADLDRLRACAMINLQNIPVGENSNQVIADAPLALSLDNTSFYYVTSTAYGVLQSNGVLETTVVYDEIPFSFCGAF
jgi:hypothetical protein